MERIAFYLGGPPFVAFDQQSDRHAAKGHCRCVEERPARYEIFRLPHVGDDRLGRLACARRQACQRQRGAHQLQERPALDRVADGLDLRRELDRKSVV